MIGASFLDANLKLPLFTPPSSPGNDDMGEQLVLESSDDDLEITNVVRRDSGDVDEYVESKFLELNG